jgi:hypothetical protein
MATSGTDMLIGEVGPGGLDDEGRRQIAAARRVAEEVEVLTTRTSRTFGAELVVDAKNRLFRLLQQLEPATEHFAVSDTGRPVWLEPARWPTVSDLELAERAELKRREEVARREREELMRLPARSLGLSDLHDARVPTLREAVHRLEASYGAEFHEAGGCLDIRIRLRPSGAGAEDFRAAVRVALAAEPTILAQLRKGRKGELAERLADRPVGPTGVLG